MALIPLKTSRAWDPEEYARFPDDVRHRHLRSDLADALLGIGRITTTTLPPEPGVFPPRRRIMETLEIWVDPLAAHARAAAPDLAEEVVRLRLELQMQGRLIRTHTIRAEAPACGYCLPGRLASGEVCPKCGRVTLRCLVPRAEDLPRKDGI